MLEKALDIDRHRLEEYMRKRLKDGDGYIYFSLASTGRCTEILAANTESGFISSGSNGRKT